MEVTQGPSPARELAAFTVMVGAGVCSMMQNLVLVTQNTVAQRDIEMATEQAAA